MGQERAPSVCRRVLRWPQVNDGCSGSTWGKTSLGGQTQDSLQGRHGSGLQAEQGQKEQGLPGPPGETRSSGLAQVASVSAHS